MRRIYFVMALIGLCAVLFVTVFLMVQHRHQPRILAVMNVVEKPIFMSAQLFHLKNQSYSNFDISVSVKGIQQDKFDPFRKELDAWKRPYPLVVGFSTTKNPLSDFLDAFRQVNTDLYELYCPIQPENWYADTYLDDMANVFKQHKSDHYFVVYKARHFVNKGKTMEADPYYSAHSMGGFCFSKKVLYDLFYLEKYPENLKLFIPDSSQRDLKNISVAEIIYYVTKVKSVPVLIEPKDTWVIYDDVQPVLNAVRI